MAVRNTTTSTFPATRIVPLLSLISSDPTADDHDAGFPHVLSDKDKVTGRSLLDGPYLAVLRDTSCASRKPDWRSRHAAAPRVLPTPRLLTSLRRFAAFLRLIFSASFFPGWRPRRSS